MKNSKLAALNAAFLLCCQLTNATTLVVLVSQDSVVLGGDSKGVDTVSHGTESIEKVVIVNDHVFVSSIGLGESLSTDGRFNYKFTSWIHTLPVGRDAGPKDVALAIRDGCWSVFKSFPVTSLPGIVAYGQDPLVSYYVAGTESAKPIVYSVAVYIDWNAKQTKKPTVELLYPTSQNVRLFVRWNGLDDGGIAKLFLQRSAIQTEYLKQFPMIVGPVVSDGDDKPLDTESLIRLARVMLGLEIKTSPAQFAFPIKVCFAKSNQRTACRTFKK